MSNTGCRGPSDAEGLSLAGARPPPGLRRKCSPATARATMGTTLLEQNLSVSWYPSAKITDMARLLRCANSGTSSRLVDDLIVGAMKDPRWEVIGHEPVVARTRSLAGDEDVGRTRVLMGGWRF